MTAHHPVLVTCSRLTKAQGRAQPLATHTDVPCQWTLHHMYSAAWLLCKMHSDIRCQNAARRAAVQPTTRLDSDAYDMDRHAMSMVIATMHAGRWRDKGMPAVAASHMEAWLWSRCGWCAGNKLCMQWVTSTLSHAHATRLYSSQALPVPLVLALAGGARGAGCSSRRSGSAHQAAS